MWREFLLEQAKRCFQGVTFRYCLFHTRFVLAGKRIAHYLFEAMSDSRSLYDIQRECAQSQEISDWNVFWTLYDDVEELCVSDNEKPISIVDVSIAIHQKVKLDDRCPFERTDCRMEKRIIGSLSSIIQPREFEFYSSRLLQLIDLYYHHFVLSPLLLEQFHRMYITLLQWLQQTPESSLQSVLPQFLFSFLGMPEVVLFLSLRCSTNPISPLLDGSLHRPSGCANRTQRHLDESPLEGSHSSPRQADRSPLPRGAKRSDAAVRPTHHRSGEITPIRASERRRASFAECREVFLHVARDLSSPVRAVAFHSA